MYDYGWRPYVSVAARRRKAAREMAKLRKKGHRMSPVVIEGRTIARTFWGKAWCDEPRALQRLREPAAARPHLRAQRLGDRPADRARRGEGAGQRLGDLHGGREGGRRAEGPLELHLQGLRGRHRLAGRAAAGALLQGRDGAHLPAEDGAVPGAGARSSSRAAARTGPRCASTSRPCSTASAPGSTSSPSSSSRCARSTRRTSSPGRARAALVEAGPAADKVLASEDLSEVFGLEMATPGEKPPPEAGRAPAQATRGRRTSTAVTRPKSAAPAASAARKPNQSEQRPSSPRVQKKPKSRAAPKTKKRSTAKRQRRQ